MAKIQYKIPFNKPYFSENSIDNIKYLIENQGSLEGSGFFAKKCQQFLEEKYNIKKVLLTNSCTAALEMSMILSDIKNGDEVIMPSYTFVSTANAVILRGGIPVFVDIKADDFNINPDLIEKAITQKTKAIVPVHYSGNACNMDKINEIAKKYNLFVIEDAAQGINSYYRNKALGSIGDLGAVSFHSTKNIQAGECGAIYINNDNFLERADIIIEKGTNRKAYINGQTDKYTWVDTGSSYYPSELTSAFLYAQLQDIDKITQNRLNLLKKYNDFFKVYENKGILKTPKLLKDCTPNAHICYVLMNTKENRDNLLQYLRGNGIQAQTHFVPLHSSPFGREHTKIGSPLNITEKVYETSLRLPLYCNMTEEEMAYIFEIMSCFLEKLCF